MDRVLAVATTVLIALVSAATAVPAAKAAFPGRDGEIAVAVGSGCLSLDINGDCLGGYSSGIHSVRPDSGERRVIVRCPDSSLCSPSDASRVATFSSATAPAFSPDGRRIAAVATAPTTNPNASVGALFISAADGTNAQVTSLDSLPVRPRLSDPNPFRVDWQASGKRLLLSSGLSLAPIGLNAERVRPGLRSSRGHRAQVDFGASGLELRVYPPGRSNWRVVARGQRTTGLLDRQLELLDWSPDGRRLLFLRGRDLMSVSPKGGGQRLILRLSRFDDRPGPKVLVGGTWSPSGRYIALTAGPEPSSPAQDAQVWLVAAVGGRPRLLLGRETDRADYMSAPTWQALPAP